MERIVCLFDRAVTPRVWLVTTAGKLSGYFETALRFSQ